MENEAFFSRNQGNYDSLDLMKCVLSLIIVAAHASPFVNGYEMRSVWVFSLTPLHSASFFSFDLSFLSLCFTDHL